MRFSALAITAYVALLQPVAANFDVYMVDVYDAIFNSHSRVRPIGALLVAEIRMQGSGRPMLMISTGLADL